MIFVYAVVSKQVFSVVSQLFAKALASQFRNEIII